MSMHKKFWNGMFSLLLICLLVGTAGNVQAFEPTAEAEYSAAQSFIVQSTSSQQAARLVEQFGGKVTSRLDIIYSVGALLSPDALAALRADARIVRISSNAETRLADDRLDGMNANTPATDYPDITGADLAWEQGVTGAGVTVAVIDTGVAMHPELLKDSNGRPRKPVIGWVDFVEGKAAPFDPNGHGTHIAGIIANTSIGADGEFNGMAPGVDLVGIRVLDKTGTGTYETVIQGIQWAVNMKDRYGIKVINLSLHSLVQSPYWADPLNMAVMRAWAEGITVVVAAGNDGPNPMTISVPGNNPYVITVGAFTDNFTPSNWNDDYLTEFSSAGPTLDGFVKPDLLAPGAHITSTMLPAARLAREHSPDRVGDLYFSMAGTSQAAAVASGAAATVIARHPDLSPDEIKYRLMVTALPWINEDQTDVLYSAWQQGAGRLNTYDAIFAEDIAGSANEGLDLQADINGANPDDHFQGYSYFDDTTGTFRLHGYESLTGGYGSWAGGYGSWAGGYGSWAGGYGSWAGGYGSWAGGYGSWAGGYGSWAGGYGSWAGGYGSWAGGYGSWAGGYGSWAGGYGSWAGGYGVWAGQLVDPTFVANFVGGFSPDVDSTTASINWVVEK